MKQRIDRRTLATLLLLAPAAALSALIGSELGWGNGVGWELKQQLAERAQLPKKNNSAAMPALPPEFGLAPLDQAYTAVVERPIFVPTRRMSPGLSGEGGGSIQRGQFVLTGVILSNGRNIALLREVSSGRMLRVEQGAQVNGMLVDKLEPDKVVLKQGNDVEEVVLKIPAASKTPPPTTQATPPVLTGLGGTTAQLLPTPALQGFPAAPTAPAAPAAMVPPVAPAKP